MIPGQKRHMSGGPLLISRVTHPDYTGPGVPEDEASLVDSEEDGEEDNDKLDSDPKQKTNLTWLWPPYKTRRATRSPSERCEHVRTGSSGGRPWIVRSQH